MKCWNWRSSGIRLPRTLSLGQRIRADLAISLMHSPELILLDEPTIGLDTLLKIKFRGILKTLNAVYGTTVLLTTHDMNDIEAVCSRVIILHRGSIAFDGSVSDLRRRVTNETEIRLEFSDMSAQQNLALFPKELVTASVVSPAEIRVRFRDFEIPTHRVLQMAVQASALESLAILNPSIEEIIAQIYTEHGERP
ncbi:MAG: ATP-binding cassette domain-containing protein [bacterium]|nr:ATP-binding cassette domain-containing protein [bacterium]